MKTQRTRVFETEKDFRIYLRNLQLMPEAFNYNDAKQIAVREAEAMYGDCYVWEVTEDDVVPE